MSYSATKVIQYSIYENVNGVNKYVEDTRSYKRPDIETLTDSFKGAGIMGEIDMPTLGQLAAMEIELGLNRANKRATKLFAPGSHKIEARWAMNALNKATGSSTVVPYKEILTVLPKNLSLGDIEGNEANEVSMTFEVLAYEYIANGISLIKIDKLNQVFIVDGKDYSAKIREAL